MKPNSVLLHTCCAPCLLYPYERLKSLGYNVVCYWYNPNIFPYLEKQKRFLTLQQYCQKENIMFYFSRSMPDDFFRSIFMLRNLPSRCSKCWFLRLKKTALVAKKLGCSAFTTTLLVSKYQDPKEINRLGIMVSKMVGIRYLDFDFRDGFTWAYDRAKQIGLYLQKWCGCIFSYNARLAARSRRRKNKAKKKNA